MIAMKDEQLIYDLVGYNSSQHDPKVDVSSNLSRNLNDSSRSEDPNTVEAILYRVIKQTLVAYSCDQKLKPGDIISMLDPNELG